MNKRLLLATVLCIAHGTGFQQEPRPSSSDYENVREESVSLTNRWLVRMKKIADCPLYDLSLTLELFEVGAKIYTSSTRSTAVRWYWPREYFTTVNGLKCRYPP